MVQSIFGSSTANYWAAKLSAAQLENLGILWDTYFEPSNSFQTNLAKTV
jgi:hypothetical protein